MGEGEKRMCSENKNIRKIVVNNKNGSKIEKEFKDNKSVNEYWHSLITDLDDVDTIDFFTKINGVYVKKGKYIKKKDLMKFL